jgi:Methyltransferase domain
MPTTTYSHLRRLVRKTRRVPSRIGRAPAYIGRFARDLKSDPVETLRAIPESVSSHLFDVAVDYCVEEDFGPAFHQMLGLPWPCDELDQFHAVWTDIERDLHTRGLALGRWTYGEYSDADPALGAVTWCAVRHLRPETAIETGVARGITSRLILEAMSFNGDGHLWSVDLPHPLRPELHNETASAVSSACRDRWTYVRGSSRSQLPSLVSRLKEVDMFVHDSLHTARNVRFELRTVWPAISRGGLVLVDDVENQAFRNFVQESGGPRSVVMRSADGPWKFGAVRKDGATGHIDSPSSSLHTSLSLGRREAQDAGTFNGQRRLAAS